MTKLVLFSDTHHGGNFLFDLPEGDISIFAGDMCDWSKKERVFSFLDWYTKQPPKNKLWIAGNHDIPMENMNVVQDAKQKYPNLIYLQDSFVTINGLKIWGSPFQVEYAGWAFGFPRDGKELEAKWAAIPSDTDIVVTHGPPYHILDRNQEGIYCGDKLLANRLFQIKPSFWVGGHIHEAASIQDFNGTCFVNASMCDRRNNLVNKPIELEIE